MLVSVMIFVRIGLVGSKAAERALHYSEAVANLEMIRCRFRRDDCGALHALRCWAALMRIQMIYISGEIEELRLANCE